MNDYFTFRTLLAFTAVAAAIPASVAAACWYPDEIVADQVKDFQYMLMVGALQCRTTVGPGNEAYNSFIVHQRGVLDSKAYVLKGHFLRENGVAGGREAYDRNNTAMSNRHAGRFDDASFCQTIAAYTRMAATVSDRDFITLAQSVIEAPQSSCAPAGFSPAAAPLAPIVRRPEPSPLVEAATLAVADDPYAGRVIAEPRYETTGEPVVLASVEAAVDRPTPVAGPESRLEPQVPVLEPVATPAVARAVLSPVRVAAVIPTTTIAASPIVPPEDKTAPSPAAALQAAIAALQAAAEALKAQSGPTN